MAEEYIKKEDAMQSVIEHDLVKSHWSRAWAEYMLENAKPADVAPVVRCANCKCWTEWANGTGSCSRFALDWIGTDADDFCSMGERKDNE